MGDDANTSRFTFDQGLLPGFPTANLERLPFDAMLLGEVRGAGAEVREGVGLERIVKLADGDVCVSAGGGGVRGRGPVGGGGGGAGVGGGPWGGRGGGGGRLYKGG